MPFRWFVMSTSIANGKVYLVGGTVSIYPHTPYLAEVLEYSPEY